jgi:hypothetical protein
MIKTIRFTTIEMWWSLLGLIALVIIFSWHPREFMTNADVKAKMDFHASKPKSWNMPKTKEKDPNNKLMGPRISTEQEKEVEEAKQKDSADTSSTYPEVYGPQALHSQVPGQSAEFASNINFEFPKGPEYPQPFLADFSKFQK